jgi:hypothetical protein
MGNSLERHRSGGFAHNRNCACIFAFAGCVIGVLGGVAGLMLENTA